MTTDPVPDDGTDLYRFWRALEDAWNDSVDRAERAVAASTPALPLAGTRLAAEDALTYLLSIRSQLVDLARPSIDVFSPSTWLWYLRRVDPNLIPGERDTTPTNVLRVAENLSSGSARSYLWDQPESETPFTFPLDALTPVKVADLIALAAFINLAENHIRRAAKGQQFAVTSTGLPTLIKDQSLEKALIEFDRRASLAAEMPWHPTVDIMAPATRGSQMGLTVGRSAHGWMEVPGWTGSISSGKPLTFQGQFGLTFYNLRDTRTGIDMLGSAAAMRQPRLAAMLVAMSRALAKFALLAPHAGTALPSVGYIIIHLDSLVEFLRESLDEAPWAPLAEIWATLSPTEIIKAMRKYPEMGTRSTHGPILRVCSVGYMIDAFSLTAELFECVRIDPGAGGEWVNAASFDFEIVAQDLINETDYRPRDSILAKRGRTLSDSKGQITDIDAILEVGATLVLVSCKQVEYSREFDRGDYQKVLANESTVVEGLKKWEGKVARFRQEPRGKNYDFTAFDRIEGILITPNAVFLKDVSAFDDLGLAVPIRPHMSLIELGLALSG